MCLCTLTDVCRISSLFEVGRTCEGIATGFLLRLTSKYPRRCRKFCRGYYVCIQNKNESALGKSVSQFAMLAVPTGINTPYEITYPQNGDYYRNVPTVFRYTNYKSEDSISLEQRMAVFNGFELPFFFVNLIRCRNEKE